MLSLLDFSSFEDGTDRLSHNVHKELLFYPEYSFRRVEILHDDLAMQSLVWHHTVLFRAVQFGVLCFGMVQFGASYVNLRLPLIECQI